MLKIDKIHTFLKLIVLFIVLSCSCAEATDILYYGHRGLTDRYPENTMISFKAAMNAGFDGIEFDVFQTKSDDLLVFHDTSLKRLCKKTGEIYSVTEKNRGNYPIKTGSNAYRLKKTKRLIPTFEEVVRYMAAKKGKMFIHLKGTPHYTATGIAKMTSILQKYNMENQSVIFCGNFSLLKKFQKKGFTVGYLEISSNKDVINKKLQLCIQNQIDIYVMFMPEWLTKSIVKTCRQNNMEVGVYKVRTRTEAKRLKNMKVNFMFNYGKLLK